MRRSSYDAYRGRSRSRSILKGIIAVLAVLLVLAVLSLVFFQRYLIFSADGVHFELPFLHRTGEEPGDTPEPTLSELPEPEDLPVVVTTDPEIVDDPSGRIRAVLLPREALHDGSAQQLLTDAGANAVILDMKADDGSLGYVSSLKLAGDIHATAAGSTLNDTIREFCSGEIYTVARVSCFRDNLLPYYRNGMALRKSGGNWRDELQLRWSSPASEKVWEYLIGVCTELVDLGFDEIWLDCAAFPTGGDLSRILSGENYSPGKLAAPVSGFYEALTSALAEEDVLLSVSASLPAVLSGSDSVSGQTLEALALFDRVWLRGADDRREECLGALRGAGYPDAENALVLVDPAREPTGDGCWAKTE